MGCALWLMALSSPALSQPDAAPPGDLLFGEEIDVRVVNVEVVVEDRAGNRVHGLEADDFRLSVDGVEVEVDYFTEVLQGRATDGNGDAPPAIGEGGAVATNYLLYVDDTYTQEAMRRHVLHGFRDELEGLPPLDQVAVVVRSRNRLELLSPFTGERDETRVALAELDRGGRFGGALRSMRLARGCVGGSEACASGSPEQAGFQVRGESGATAGLVAGGASVYDELPRSSSPSGLRFDADPAGQLSAAVDALAGMSLVDEAESALLERELTLAVDAVISAMRALKAPEGRNVLLLLAGWPVGVFRSDSQYRELLTELDLLDGLVDTANLLGYTVYPMDQQTAPNMRRWQNLRHMARQTGGLAFMAGSQMDALARVSEDTSNYYWLGFRPDYRRDDRVHDVQVEVLRPGLKVRARRGYLDLSRSAEADMEAQRALLFGRQNEPAAEVLRAGVGTARPLGRRMMAVPIDIEVPLGMFPALPHGNEYLQRLEVRLATIDAAGWRAEQPAIPLEVRRRFPPQPDTVFDFHAEVTMRRLPHTVVVTVHDTVSRETVSTRLDVVP